MENIEEIIIDETIVILEDTLFQRIKWFVLENPDLTIMIATLILVPIGMLIKIKLDKMTDRNDKYFPSVEKYEKLFKMNKNNFNEATKPKSSSNKGW